MNGAMGRRIGSFRHTNADGWSRREARPWVNSERRARGYRARLFLKTLRRRKGKGKGKGKGKDFMGPCWACQK